MNIRFAQKAFAAVAVLSMIAVQTPAQASDRCNGCNVRDEQVFHSGLIGYTVYVRDNAYRVTGVDTYNGKLSLVDSTGRAFWSYASETYSVGAKRERESNWVAAGVVGGAILACLVTGCGQSRNSGSSTSNTRVASTNRSTDYYTYRQTQTPSYSPPASTTQPISSFYGSNHGSSIGW